MKRISLILSGLAIGAAVTLLPSAGQAAIGIVGSPHDFYQNTNAWIGGTTKWVSSTTNVCGECHTVHSSVNPAWGPLWVHSPSSQTYKTYDQAGSDTFDSLGLTITLGTSSKACLSCHDGTVAINDQTTLSDKVSGTTTNRIRGTTPVFVDDGAIIPVNHNDLTHTHPVGVSYTAAQGALPTGDLNDPNGTFPNTAGSPKIINQLKGLSKTVECSSCHDIHKTRGYAPSSGRMTVANGQNLCLGCHNK